MDVWEPTLAQAQRDQVTAIIRSYQEKRGGLIPVLHEVQKVLGYLPEWAQAETSETLEIPLSEISSIVSFYSLFTEHPKGKYCIGICKGTACYVRGAEKLVKRLKELLSIEVGHSTQDGLFSLEVLRCLGACGLGPVITVNEDVYSRVKPDKLKGILEEYRSRGKGGASI